MNQDDEPTEPILVFPTDNPDFALGFEAGRIWELLKQDPALLHEQPIHSANAEVVIRMLEALDSDLKAEFADDAAWMFLVAA